MTYVPEAQNAYGAGTCGFDTFGPVCRCPQHLKEPMPHLTRDHVHPAERSSDQEHLRFEVLDVDEAKVVADTRRARHVDGQAAKSITHLDKETRHKLAAGGQRSQVSKLEWLSHK